MNQITCINEIIRASSPLLYRKYFVLDCEYGAGHEDSQANDRFLIPPFHSVAVYPTNRTGKVLAPSDIAPRDRWFLKLRMVADMGNERGCREKINLVIDVIKSSSNYSLSVRSIEFYRSL